MGRGAVRVHSATLLPPATPQKALSQETEAEQVVSFPFIYVYVLEIALNIFKKRGN